MAKKGEKIPIKREEIYSFGGKGFFCINDTDEHDNLDTYMIMVLEDDTVFTVFEENDVDVFSKTGLSGLSLPKYTKLTCDLSNPKGITKIQLSAGSVICYKKQYAN
jgi:hypothetical protein